MCGRYYIDDSLYAELQGAMFAGFDYGKKESSRRVIYPSMQVPILSKVVDDFVLQPMNWGYVNHENSGLIINARAESILEKPMFQAGIRSHRVVVPATGFYEWNSRKEKRTFVRADQKRLYMAGISDIQEQNLRFCIVTTQANASMIGTHDRMPLILEEEQVQDWLRSEQGYRQILEQTPVQLTYTSEYEQMTLFDM